MRKEVMAGIGSARHCSAGRHSYFREKSQESPDYPGAGERRRSPNSRLSGADCRRNRGRRPASRRARPRAPDPRRLSVTAKSRDGEELAMMNPVIQDSGDPMASDPPLFDDDLQGAWRTRFVGRPAARNSPTPLPGSNWSSFRRAR